MPPPVEDWSDEESGDIPFTTAPEEKNGAQDSKEDEEEDDDDEEEEEGVYVVEGIKEHRFEVDGSLFLLVKWKGYEDLADQTWEPEDGLKEGAEDVLNAYYKKIGGRPEKQRKAAKGHGRKRKSMAEKKESPASAATESKRRRQSAPKAEAKKDTKAEDKTPAVSDDDEPSDWVPKSKDWEKEVKSVDTIIRDPNDQQLYALLLWNNGKRSRISIKSCYDNCPLTMLKFYEKHLVFKDG